MKKRKFISALLAACLLVTMFPALTFAQEAPAPEDPAVIQESTEPDTAVLENNTDSVPAQQPSDSVIDPCDIVSQPPQDTLAESSAEAIKESTVSEETSSADAETSSQELFKKAAAPAAVPKEDKALTSTVSQPAASVKTVAEVEKTVNGIRISGGVEGKDWTYDSKAQTLTITKDGLTVSGTATDNLAILCTIAVSAITLQDLDQGKHAIILMSMPDVDMIAKLENGLDDITDIQLQKVFDTNLTVTAKGNNTIATAISTGDLTIQAAKGGSLAVAIMAAGRNLTMTGAGRINTLLAGSGRDINIRDIKVKTSLLIAGRDINIYGKSKVTIAPDAEAEELLELGLFPAMAFAGRDINIDLAPGGIVKARGMKLKDTEDPLFTEVYPMMAMRHINITKGSNVVTPAGGTIGTVNLLGVIPVQVLLNPEDGNMLTSAAQTGVSPETGDVDTDILMWLYLLLAVSGIAALLTRKISKQ